MKKLFITFLTLTFAFTSTVFSQVEEMNKWSLSYGFGSHFFARPLAVSNNNLRNISLGHHEINARYMINNRMGVQFGVGYDQMAFAGLKTNGKHDKTHFFGVTVQSVINIGDIIRLHELHNRFGLLLHGGGGYGAMFQTRKDMDRSKVDNMIVLKMGLTPQLRLSDHWALFGDVSTNATFRQHKTFNYVEKITNDKKINSIGGFFDVSLGITYYIGKNKRHADWTPTELGKGPVKVDLSEVENENEKLRNRIATIEEQLQDDDNDGVANKFDKEPNTPKGALVNASGEQIEELVDTDGDGIPDKYDDCPEEYGTWSNNGCPVSKETTQVIREISRAIYFNTGKNTIVKTSYGHLDRLVELMQRNKEFAISIEGHTDNVGDKELNLKLSKDRAVAVKEYLTEKGIDASRISSEGFGDTKPVENNDTEEGRAKNRRVEIKTTLSFTVKP